MHLKYAGNYLTVVQQGQMPHKRVEYVLMHSVMTMRGRGGVKDSSAAEVFQRSINNIH